MAHPVSKLLSEGAIIIDVRSPEEFRRGANPKSVNIPLDNLPNQLRTLDKNKTYVMCCASGGRSAMATSVLKSEGFKTVMNAGPWQNTVI